MMKDPFKMRNLKIETSYKIVLGCSLLGLLWALLPIFGWSYYTLEGAMTSCSVKWNERSFNVVSYNVTIFIFTYFLPLVAIVKINIKLILMVSLKKAFIEEIISSK